MEMDLKWMEIALSAAQRAGQRDGIELIVAGVKCE